MQTILMYIANFMALLSLRALVSRQALLVYGGLLLLIGCVIGHVALILLGIACLYFALRDGKHFELPKHDGDLHD